MRYGLSINKNLKNIKKLKKYKKYAYYINIWYFFLNIYLKGIKHKYILLLMKVTISNKNKKGRTYITKFQGKFSNATHLQRRWGLFFGTKVFLYNVFNLSNHNSSNSNHTTNLKSTLLLHTTFIGQKMCH